jgi:hypothetical protein
LNRFKIIKAGATICYTERFLKTTWNVECGISGLRSVEPAMAQRFVALSVARAGQDAAPRRRIMGFFMRCEGFAAPGFFFA